MLRVETPHGARRRQMVEGLLAPVEPGAWRLAEIDPEAVTARLTTPAGLSLRVRISSRKEPAAFARTVFFSVMHEGSAALGVEAKTLLSRVVDVIARREVELSGLDGFPGALFDRRPSILLIHPHTSDVELRPSLVCDHHCGFCNSVDYTVQNFTQGLSDLRALADLLDPLPVVDVTISGGEPTLLPGLPASVSGFADRGFRVTLQTNGMALADRAYTRELQAAGLQRAHISLHSHDAALSDDRITHYPGGWERTVRGIDAALDAGIRVSLSHVLHRVNGTGLEEFARFVGARWGRRLLTSISFVAPTGAAAEEVRREVPPMEELLPSIRSGLRLFRSLRLRVLVQSYCGVPPCLLGDSWAVSDTPYLAPRAYPADRVHPAACNGCVYRSRCPGLWRAYYDTYGDPGVAPMPGGTLHAVERFARSWAHE